MKKRISVLLALLFLAMPLTALGEAEARRDETVYAALDPSGKVRSVEIVTHRAPMKDEAVDYGKFTNLKLLDGAKPEEQAGTLVWKKGALDRDTYYSVTSEKKPPVHIAITYALDGKEMSASEIAGKSGEFTISLSLGKTDLMTQVSLVLPLERFSDIHTDGMKSVVGKNTRVTVTHLGTEAKTYEISGTISPGSEKSTSSRTASTCSPVRPAISRAAQRSSPTVQANWRAAASLSRAA